MVPELGAVVPPPLVPVSLAEAVLGPAAVADVPPEGIEAVVVAAAAFLVAVLVAIVMIE